MTVAFDAFWASAAGNTPRIWTHTPTATPRGVLVFVGHDGLQNDIPGVDYGGVAMKEIPNSPVILTAGEGMFMYGYFLGAGIPTGAQTVTAATIASVGNKIGFSISLTANDDTEIVNSVPFLNTEFANPSDLLNLFGRTCFVGMGWASGEDAVTGVTELAGWTLRNETDAGTETTGCYTYNTIGSANVQVGITQVANDAIFLAAAVSEIAVATPRISRPPRKLLPEGIRSMRSLLDVRGWWRERLAA